MQQDGVASALELILDEIAEVITELGPEGAVAFKGLDFDRVKQLSEIGTRLAAFKTKVEGLQEEWANTFDTATRKRASTERVHQLRRRMRGPDTLLRVTLPTGRVIERDTGAETFLDTIEALGVERVRRLGIKVVGIPLVSETKDPKYAQHKRAGYYIVTHTSTEAKQRLLATIGKGLGIDLRVDVIHSQR